MFEVAGVLVTATIVTLMFSLGLGLKPYPVLLRDRPAFFWRVLLGTCVLVPLAGLALVLMPLYGLLSRPVWVAMALMLACPSAPLILFRVRSSGGTAELAARLQIGAALLAIVTVPLMEVIFRSGAALRGLELVSWGITPSQVAGQVLRVQVLPVLAGVLLGQWQPELARRCSRALGGLATVLLILMLLALLLLSGPQLLPFLQHNLVGLVGMAVLSVLSLAPHRGPGDRDAQHGSGRPTGADLRQGAARTGAWHPRLRADHGDRHHPFPEMAAAAAGHHRLIIRPSAASRTGGFRLLTQITIAGLCLFGRYGARQNLEIGAELNKHVL
jgi:hypothetical protein